MGALNMNMNMNMAAGMLSGSGGTATRVRYNTQDYWKYINQTDPIIPSNHTAMHFPEYWDSDLRSYKYLNEFLFNHQTWRTVLGTTTIDLTPPHLLPDPALTTEVQGVITVALDREDRFLEIIDQNEAEGAISYFFGMLMVDPAHYPKTNLLIRVARRVGEHIVMCLKEEFRCPRPSQMCSGIVPLIDPPSTPSFPSGHSLQARLIYKCLDAANPPMQPRHLLVELADQIGKNRIIAGLHFPKDHLTGQAVADWCFGLLNTGTAFNTLVGAANTELNA